MADIQKRLTAGGKSIVHKHLRPRFGKAPIGSIDFPIVLAYVAQLREAGVAPKTVRNIRDVMRMILKLAVRSGALKSNPVEDVPVGQTQRAETRQRQLFPAGRGLSSFIDRLRLELETSA